MLRSDTTEHTQGCRGRHSRKVEPKHGCPDAQFGQLTLSLSSGGGPLAYPDLSGLMVSMIQGCVEKHIGYNRRLLLSRTRRKTAAIDSRLQEVTMQMKGN